MTIYELKALNLANGGCWFHKANLKADGDTLKSFSVTRDVDPEQVVVTRKRDGKSWRFDRATGRMRAPLSLGKTFGNTVIPPQLTQVTHVEGDAVVDSKGNVWHAA